MIKPNVNLLWIAVSVPDGRGLDGNLSIQLDLNRIGAHYEYAMRKGLRAVVQETVLLEGAAESASLFRQSARTASLRVAVPGETFRDEDHDEEILIREDGTWESGDPL